MAGKRRVIVLRVSARLAGVISMALCGSATAQAQDNPPRIEIGGVLSSTSQSKIGNNFHTGGGGRVAVNVTRSLAGEVEATRQPGDLGQPTENHIFIAAKVTYRADLRSLCSWDRMRPQCSYSRRRTLKIGYSLN